MRFTHRNVLLVLLLLALFCVPGTAFSATTTLHVNVDGKATNLEAVSTGNLVFLPARDLASLFQATLSYNADDKELILKTANNKQATLYIGSSTITWNNKKVSLDASPMIVDGKTMVPMKAASVIWGASYGWNEQTLYIKKDGSPVQVPVTEKVHNKRDTVSINGKSTEVNYLSIPKSSGLKADVILAQNVIGQTESLSSLAKRSAAKAAINGSYFQSYDSSRAQDPYGLLIKSGKLVHAESTGSAIGITSGGSVKIGIVRANITASVGQSSYTINMVNHVPSANSNTIVLFNSARGATTGCSLGTSVLVQNGEVVSVVSKQSVSIPANGYVLLFTGDKASVAQNLQKGTKVSYTVGYTNAAGNSVDWSNVETAVGAGPMLLKDGSNVVNPEKEGFTDTAGFNMTTTRSAVGVTSSGDILLVGGVKCTLNQLASVMSQLGATQAIAMDSGASSGLYMPNSTVSAPSRDISNALIFK